MAVKVAGAAGQDPRNLQGSGRGTVASVEIFAGEDQHDVQEAGGETDSTELLADLPAGPVQRQQQMEPGLLLRHMPAAGSL